MLFSPVYALFLVVFLVACGNNWEGNRGDSGTDNSRYSGTDNSRYYEKDNSEDSGGDNGGGSGAPATSLAVITNVQATAADKQVTLSWDAADGVDSYNIYYAEESFVDLSGDIDIDNYNKLKGGARKLDVTNTSTSETIQDLTNDTNYYFVVTSVKGSRESEASDEVLATPVAPLAVVTNVHATAADKQVTLSWKATADDVDSYNIYYAEKSFADLSGDIAKYKKLKGGTLKSDIMNTSETIKALTNDTKYYFVVTSVQGSRESKASAEVSVTTPLAVVTNVQATAADKQVTLSWDAADGVDSYNIYYAEESFAGDIAKYMELKGGTLKSAITTSETINDLTNDTEYYFVVTTVKGGREGKASDEVLARPLAVVTNVQATAADKQVTLSWDTADGVDSYNIYYAEESFVGDIAKYMELKGGTLESDISKTKTSETITDLTNDTNYYFVVTTVKGSRESKASAEVSVTTPLSVVTNVHATAADKQVALSWKATADDVDSYNIYYAEESFVGDIAKYMELKGGTLESDISKTKTSETIQGLTNDTNYYFVVTSVKGSRESKASAEVSVTTPLSVVTNVQATAADKQVTLSWKATADDVESYNIYYAEESFVGDIAKYMELKGGTLESDISKTKTSETITDLTNDTNYYFVVTSVKGSRESEASAEVSVTTPLAVVTNVQATAADKQVALSWKATADDVDSYNIYYAEESFADLSGDIAKYKKLKGGTLESDISKTKTSETIQGLTNDTNYYFVVTSVKGSRESEASDEVLATPVAPLAVVTNVQATAADKQVALSWKATADDVDSYNIYYAEESFADLSGDIAKYKKLKGGTLESDISKTKTSETIQGLTNDTNYYFVVTSVKGSRESEASDEVLATPVAPLAVVTNVQATAADKQVALSWKATADDVDSYNIYYAEESFVGDIAKYMELKGGTLESDISKTKTSETIQGLTNDTKYYFVVTSVVKKGSRESEASDEVLATPVAPLAVVTNVQATAVHEQVTLSWDAADGVGSYNIYYAEESFSGDSANYITRKGGTLQLAITNTSETINDLTNDTNYYFVVTSVKGDRESEDSTEVSVATPPQRLNDTGITWGGRYPSGNKKSCTSNDTIDASQDCDQGRDATHNDDSDGHAGFSFTKLDADGKALAIQNRDWSTDSLGTESSGTKWSCVRDNVTGLTWEIKNTDGTAPAGTATTSDDNIHHKDNRYKWGGITAIGRNYDITYGKGNYDDDWNTLVNGSNSEELCGYNDWRAPTQNELLSITNLGRRKPAIDTHYFPNTENAEFWSASPYAFNSYQAWIANFKSGRDVNQSRNKAYRLRLVRGGEPVHNRPYVSAKVPAGSRQRVEQYIVNEWPDDRYTVHDNGTVTDKVTTLIWKQCPEGFTGKDCGTADSPSTSEFNWKAALERAKTVNNGDGFAGSTDWRLPNRNELLSLPALDRYQPAINIAVFPGTPPSAGFWSTSPYANGSHGAWNVNFDGGRDNYYNRNNTFWLRLVRGGQ